MKHPRTWYVVTDGGRARFLQKREASEAFDTLREFTSADIHNRTQDLGAERPGRGHESGNMGRHAIEPREDLHRAEKRKFVEVVAKAVNEADTHGDFDRLVLVAPAHALNDLEHALGAGTLAKVGARLQKDLTHVPNGELGKHFEGIGVV